MVAMLERSGARASCTPTPKSLDVARSSSTRLFISFSGIVTFRSAESLREVARALPPDRVLIETDTPYLCRCRSADAQRAGVRREDRRAAGHALGAPGR